MYALIALGSMVQTFARQMMILVVRIIVSKESSFKAGMIWYYPSGRLGGLGHLCLAAKIAAVLLVHALFLRGPSSRCMKAGLHQVSSLVVGESVRIFLMNI